MTATGKGQLVLIIIVLIMAIWATLWWINSATETHMKLISLAFLNNRDIPAKYTCDGDGINPPLEIGDIPEKAESLALIVDDPDAPAGTFVHWLVWNISKQTSKIDEDTLPTHSVSGANSGGGKSYFPPCPPSGETHHYHFRLFALDTEIEIPEGAGRKQLDRAMQGHIVEKTELIGTYKREK